MLEEFLKKRKVGSYSELNDEEKKTYKDFESALVLRKITDEEVAQFLSAQKEEIILKLASTIESNSKEDIFLKAKLSILIAIEYFLNSPKMEKKMAESAIKMMIDN